MAPQPGNTGARPDAGNKRKDAPQGAGRAFKRVKVQDARSIRSQPADAALKDGELDLQAFLNARQFEIAALQDGMRKSKALNNRRAFQLVPREMRRRTASHNVKKLPKRLRSRARREQLQDNTPTVVAGKRKPKTTRARIRLESAKRLGILAEKKRKRKLREAKAKAKNGGGSSGGGEGVESSAAIKQLIETRPARPKIRRNLLNDPPKPKAKFRKRQIEKTWLPTHLWHAKRARMTPPKEPLWRFAIPITPNEKVYRVTHRASSAKGTMLWDMSYMSTIGLYGHAAGVERTLRSLGLSHDSLWDDRGKKWREGRRKWSGMLSKQNGGDTRRQIGPATVVWNPEAVTTQSVLPEAAEGDHQKSSGNSQRQLYIRLHPSCFLEVFNILVALNKREHPRLYVEDLRFEIGSVELTGPGAWEALSSVIASYYSKGDAKEAHAKQFESMAGADNAASHPNDIVLGFCAQDPRLRYPPRTVQAQTSPEERNDSCSKALQEASDDAKPAPFLLFDRDARFKASSFPSQKSLSRRKGLNSPGQPLGVTDADPPFPVVLFASRSAVTKHSSHISWTLLAPYKCILPIWYSLVHYPMSTGGNPRVGGLDELRQVSFEQGLPWFPGDFPGTNAGADWEVEQRVKRKADWARRPKSKRIAWESIDLGAGRKGEIGIGWACEFERLFGMQEPARKEDLSPKSKDQDVDGAATNEVKDKDKMDVDGKETGPAHDSQLETGEGDTAVRKKAPKTQSPHPLTQVHHLTRSTLNALLSTKSNDALAPYSIITVKLTILGRGVAEPCARVYRLPARKNTPLPATQPEVPATQPPSQTKELPADLRDQWLAQIPDCTTKRHSPSEKKGNQPRRFPPNADFETQKLLLAQTLLTSRDPFPPEKRSGGNGNHPLVPGEEDLIGYVTKGEFSLAQGRGVAVGSISVERALEALRADGEKEGRICVVRNAGEEIGWAAKWEVV
ncbi:POPLD domain-containing protein [Diaporthe amygdali]|uniref:POPLD domain-containing protein n=1 Tax=Phomopsis amygdali TaxID=1214568 RepID=UPI0022FEB4E7|nr:POPLD domain-containing protein [Diaporthe amygdali]KAJ0123234.1 POPLD domain-containing protein [Diaporthe amygdali]